MILLLIGTSSDSYSNINLKYILDCPKQDNHRGYNPTTLLRMFPLLHFFLF